MRGWSEIPAVSKKNFSVLPFSYNETYYYRNCPEYDWGSNGNISKCCEELW